MTQVGLHYSVLNTQYLYTKYYNAQADCMTLVQNSSFLRCAGLFSLFHCLISNNMHGFQDCVFLAEVITDPGIA